MQHIKLSFFKNFLNFIRIPFFGAQRIQWIDAISKYQEFDFFKTNFTVCEEHFVCEVFNENGILRSHAIPSIFQSVENHNNNIHFQVEPTIPTPPQKDDDIFQKLVQIF